jgi:putative DNA primase/helicase
MQVFEFKHSFAGREDFTLKRTLLNELPGILNWALAGLRMLHYEDQRFMNPDSVQDFFKQLERASAPLRAFCEDCLTLTDDHKVMTDKDIIYAVYQKWAVDYEGQQRSMARESFFSELRNVARHRMEVRKRAKDGSESRIRFWTGIGLTELAQEWVADDRGLLAED